MRISRSLITLGLVLLWLARPISVGNAEEPKSTTNRDASPTSREADPVYLFLNSPSDLESFWKLIGRPDRVLLDGARYRKLIDADNPSSSPAPKTGWTISSLEVSGNVEGDWVNLSLDSTVILEKDGPEWVTLRLDGQTISEVREGDQDLATRTIENGSWQVELSGKGEHHVRLGMIAPVRSTVEGKRLELMIPAVASTSLELSVPQILLEAFSGNNEKLAFSSIAGKSGETRISTRLSPRSKLEISWRERTDPASKLPPMLEVSGDVAVEVDRDSVLCRSTWGVTSIRGTVGQITLRLDPLEEVLDVLIDNKSVLVETRREADRTVLSVPLSELLRPGSSRSVVISTRRPISADGSVRTNIQGYSFDQTKVISGMMAVSRAGAIFLNPVTTRGLRRIDPRTELPDSLRTKADTVLAFQFNGPPFELGLSIKPAPPRLVVEDRTTISIEPRSARVETRLHWNCSQGRVFSVQVHLPAGLGFESVETGDVVSSVQEVPLDPEGPPGVGVDAPRVLSIGLTPQAREADSFEIVLKGWCAIDPSKPVSIKLFQPVAESTHGGQFALVTDRNVSVELPESSDPNLAFRIDWSQPPSDWVWPIRKPGPETTLLWLRSDTNPESLPLRVTVRPRSIRHESTLTATVDGRGAEVVDEIVGEVAFGSISKIDVAIPRDAGDRWEIEGMERVAREPLPEIEADGARRYRLRFPRDVSNTFRLRIRYRISLAERDRANSVGKFSLTPIRALEGSSIGRNVRIAAEPGLRIETVAKGWTIDNASSAINSLDSGPPIQVILSRTLDSAGPILISVIPGPRVPLPGVLVSRLWIKTRQHADYGLSGMAYFWVESRESIMRVGLAPGSVLVRVRVGTSELGEGSIERLGLDQYSLRFPTGIPSGPILVAIEYQTPASASSNGWAAPRLLGDGVIQQTVWEAEIAGSRAGVGTPSGWLDENEWFWDGLIWQRRPWKSRLELANWLTGGHPRFRLIDSAEQDDQKNLHRYLFSRVGPPTTLKFPVISRYTLLLLCSGPVLLVALVILARRPPLRLMAGAAILLAFAAGLLIESSVLILALQSSTLGAVLFLIALLIHWTLERRNPSISGGEMGTIVPASSVGSTFHRPPSVGSDDSTAIRPRPTNPSAVSTADHIVLTRPIGRLADERSSSEPDLR